MKKRLIALIGLMICLTSFAQVNVAARAGGGRHGHSHSGRNGHSHGDGLDIFQFVCIIGFIGLTTYGCSTLTKKRAKKKIYKSGLDYKLVEKEISDAYFAIQKAWAGGDMTPARKYMTQRLFEKHQKKLAKMAKANKKNICEDIQLISITPWTFRKNGAEKICVKIKGSMVDYIVRTPSKNSPNNFFAKAWIGIGKIAQNCSLTRYKPQSFQEYWTFIKNPQGHWELDRILSYSSTWSFQ